MPEKPEFYVHDQDTEGDTPASLQCYVGCAVASAWLGRRKLILRLEGGIIIEFSVTSPPIDGHSVMGVQIGRERGDSTEFFNSVYARRPHTDALQGRRFTGLDGNIVTFDNAIGCGLNWDVIDFLMVSEAGNAPS